MAWAYADRWEAAWGADGAPRRGRALDALGRVADVANSLGATAGDAGAIACAIVEAVDRHGAYGLASDDLRRAWEDRTLVTVDGVALREHLDWPTVATVAETAGREARGMHVVVWAGWRVDEALAGDADALALAFDRAPVSTRARLVELSGWCDDLAAGRLPDEDLADGGSGRERAEAMCRQLRRILSHIAPPSA